MKGLRPRWLLRLGLFLYDHIGGRRRLPVTRTIDLARHPAGASLRPGFATGFEYSDGWVDDARLVVLNAMDAAEKGAKIFTHTLCESALREGDHWSAVLRKQDGQTIHVRARGVVNAAGPWAASFLQDAVHQRSTKSLRLIKGSHIVVKKLFDHPYAYIFQNPDGRIVFAINYEQDFTLVGTTDLEYTGDTDEVAIDQSEIDYLCQLTERYFMKPIKPSDVVFFSRTLMTRDEVLTLRTESTHGPWWTVSARLD